MVERSLSMREVAGSMPASSTFSSIDSSLFLFVTFVHFFKGTLCSFGIRGERSALTDFFMPKQTKQSLWFHKWINKRTINDNLISYCVTLFLCGRPCRIFSFKQCCGTFFSSENSLLIQLWKKLLFLCLPLWYCNHRGVVIARENDLERDERDWLMWAYFGLTLVRRQAIGSQGD